MRSAAAKQNPPRGSRSSGTMLKGKQNGGQKKPNAMSSSNVSSVNYEDGSSMQQSRINEEEEESKHLSSAYNDEDEEAALTGNAQSEDISTDSDDSQEDEDILIKPKDLIVSESLGRIIEKCATQPRRRSVGLLSQLTCFYP